MTRGRARVLFLVLLAAAAALRFQKIDWDGPHHLHPDERFISMVEERLSGPGSLGAYLDSRTSKVNPYNVGYGSFVYGTLPMLVAHGAGKLLGKSGYGEIFLVGRVLSGLFDLLSIWLVYRILRRFTRRQTALIGAGLLAASPLAIQLSHFWTVETCLTAFSTAALYAAVRIAQGKRGVVSVVFAGAALGLAVACKVTGLALLLPVAAAVVLGALRDGVPPPGARGRAVAGLLFRGFGILATAAVVVRVAFPYAFLGASPFSFRLDPRWLNDLQSLSRLTQTVAGFPPNFQWAGRGFLFPIRNIILWGAGPFLGLPAFAGLLWGVRALRQRKWRAHLPLLLHAFVLLGYHGLTMVKSIRYFYPIYPVLAVFAALLLERIADAGPRLPFPRLRRWAPAAALGGAFLCALAFSAIYRRDVTRVAASDWIYRHIQPPRPIANETWDDGLPFPTPGYDNGAYSGPALDMVGPDDAAKLEKLLETLRQTDVIAITSNRAYGTLTRLPDVFPMTTAFYRALFENRAGFQLVADFTSYPSLGPLRIPDDSADEAFTVYDHPRVLLFRKGPDFSEARLRSVLVAAKAPVTTSLNEWEKWPRNRRHVIPPLTPPRRAEVGTEKRLPVSETTGSVWAALLWYLALMVVGAAALPIVFTLFPRMDDRGFGFARLLGLVLATWVMTVVLTLRIVSNGRATAAACLLAVCAVAAAAVRGRGRELLRFLHEKRRSLLVSELVFAAGFCLCLGIRALNPEIYWGEKPMDFSILNILVRTQHLPPSDPWFAGAPLGYYFFGQEMVVFLTLLTDLSTRFTFNLAFGLLGGATLQGAFSLATNWGRRLRAGIAAGGFTLLIGNLSGLREWLVNKRRLDWDYFWATSRVIKDTINEYPLWSLVFADLHAHVFAIPLFFLFAATALHFVRLHAEPVASARRRMATAIFLGFLASVQALTNAWDVPLLAGLLVLVPLTAALVARRPSRAAILRAAAGFVLAGASAYLLTRPLWTRAGLSPGVGSNADAPRVAGIDILTVFGLFFFLAIGWWLSVASSRLASRGVVAPARWLSVLTATALLAALAVLVPDVFLLCGAALFVWAYFAFAERGEDRLLLGFLATAFLLVLVCQRVYIYDRMNTFFKLYVEAWLLFAVATAVLVFRARQFAGTFSRWALPARAGFFLLLAAASFTSVTAVRGAVSRHVAPYSGPSLDGLRYLETLRPGEYRAAVWIRRTIRGTPVMLEAQGPSYQDFGRISMLTGLPTVLGWDYHVKQRGNPDAEIEARKVAVRAMYESPSAAPIEGLLRRYHVGYVYVGWLEARTYPARGLAKFKTSRDLFQLVYENPETRIYRVVAGNTEDVITPERETLPEAPGPQTEKVEPDTPPVITEQPETGLAPFAGMREPRGAAVDERGRLWVADFGNSRIRIFDAEGGYLGGWGGRGDGPYGLREPCAVAIHGDNVYVADTWNGRLGAFTLAGGRRAAAGDLYGPRGVTISANGRVWVTDTGNHRVVAYDGLLQNPQKIGKKGSAPGEFSNPVGIAAAPDGRIYVADTGNRRVQILGQDGRVSGGFPFPGWGESGEPQLVFDSDGTLYATDPAAGVVLAFDASGKLQNRLAADEAGRRLERPTGLALDPKDRILYVVNSGNSSIARIRLPKRRAS